MNTVRWFLIILAALQPLLAAMHAPGDDSLLACAASIDSRSPFATETPACCECCPPDACPCEVGPAPVNDRGPAQDRQSPTRARIADILPARVETSALPEHPAPRPIVRRALASSNLTVTLEKICVRRT